MADFSVTIEQLKGVIDKLNDLNTQFNNEREKLAETAASLNGMWEGEAKDKFTAEIAKDQIQMQNFHNAIGQYIIALGEILNRYIEAEARNYETASTRTY